MPTYVYACTQCGHQFEQVQAFTDPSLTECPNCAGQLRKVFNSVGIVFKGSGFYRNDSREKARSGASGETSSDKAAEKGSGKADQSGKGTDKAGPKTADKTAASSSSGSSGSSSSGSSSSSSSGSSNSAA